MVPALPPYLHSLVLTRQAEWSCLNVRPLKYNLIYSQSRSLRTAPVSGPISSHSVSCSPQPSRTDLPGAPQMHEIHLRTFRLNNPFAGFSSSRYSRTLSWPPSKALPVLATLLEHNWQSPVNALKTAKCSNDFNFSLDTSFLETSTPPASTWSSQWSVTLELPFTMVLGILLASLQCQTISCTILLCIISKIYLPDASLEKWHGR